MMNHPVIPPFRPDRRNEEIEKTVAVLDRHGVRRFVVSLSPLMGGHYGVQARRDPDEGEPLVAKEFDDLRPARAFFDETLGKYDALVKAEERDSDEIAVYAKRIGYRKISPDCCATCRWAEPCSGRNCAFGEWRRGLRDKFFCGNSGIFGLLQEEALKRLYGPDRPPRRPAPRPVVDRDGLCDHYERRPAMN